jgi:hypothetical protein
MNHLNTERMATTGCLLIFSLIILFHFLVMLQVIPSGIVWGGRLQDRSQLLVFEAISITVNLIMLGVVAIHAGLLKVPISARVIRVALWAMFVLFLLNTLGNLFSKNEFEKLFFTPLTLLLSFFSLRLARSKKPAAAY